mgnify:CR=1 FL=1
MATALLKAAIYPFAPTAVREMVKDVLVSSGKADPSKYHAEAPLTGDESRVAEVKNVEFPKLLDPVDDLPEDDRAPGEARLFSAESGYPVSRAIPGAMWRVRCTDCLAEFLAGGTNLRKAARGVWRVLCPGCERDE